MNQTTAALDQKEVKDFQTVNVHQVSPKKRRQHNAINYKEYDKHGYKKLNSLKNNKKIEE